MPTSRYMGLTASFRLEKVDDCRATMQITLSVSQWRALAATLSTEDHAQWPLRGAIVDLISHAQKEFFFREEEKK